MDNKEIESEEVTTYSGMFSEYLSEQAWISIVDKPLVFHLRRLCTQLDTLETEGKDIKAALSSSYLQAFERLDKRRPGAPSSHSSGDPDQTSIFDHLEDD